MVNEENQKELKKLNISSNFLMIVEKLLRNK